MVAAININDKVIGVFIWNKGSINDNIRKVLTKKNIYYYNTFNGDVITDYCICKTRSLGDGKFEIYFQ